MRQMLPESSLHSNEMAVCDSDAQAQEGRSPGYLNLAALTSLFLLWGFITGLNDVLVPHLKNVFELSYTRAVLVQFYFLRPIFWFLFLLGCYCVELATSWGWSLDYWWLVPVAWFLFLRHACKSMKCFYWGFLYWLPELQYCKYRQIPTLSLWAVPKQLQVV